MLGLLHPEAPVTTGFDEVVAGVFDSPFNVTRDDVEHVVSLFKPFSDQVPHSAMWGQNGVRHAEYYELQASPGTIALKHGRGAGYSDVEAERPEISDYRRKLEQRFADLQASEPADGLEARKRQLKRGRITHWSKKSRARMTRVVAELDFFEWDKSPGDFAMVTLTLPGTWWKVAGTAKDFKAIMHRFRAQWERDLGVWRCVWKLEFQKRGAPHLHMMVKLPALHNGKPIRFWLSKAWADAVDHPDPKQYAKNLRVGTRIDWSMKATDPKRIAVYFLKHASKTTDDKEYQHVVPRRWRARGGAGRFWGYAGVERIQVTCLITSDAFFKLRRELKKLARARVKSAALQTLKWEQRKRSAGTPVVGLFDLPNAKIGGFQGLSGGWVLSNHAADTLYLLAQFMMLSDPGGNPQIVELLT